VVAATLHQHEVRGDADWAEIAVPVDHGWFEPEWSYCTDQPVAFFRPQMARASVVLELKGDWPSTYAGLKRNVKESLRRSRNRLAKDGREWAVERRTDDLDEAVVDRFLDLHRDRAHQDAGVIHPDAFRDPARRALLREVLPALGRRGRATMMELYLGGDLVATQLALHAPGTTYLHSSGFVPAVWSLGPVTFLQGLLAADAADRGERWVNFSPGPNVAKLRWSELLDVHQDFAYGAGGRSLRWRYGLFAVGQANEQVTHAVSESTRHSAPARVDPAAGTPRKRS
jgi:CelD/BcsL family acetyltransferase involved in cellulose biosynthesis